MDQHQTRTAEERREREGTQIDDEAIRRLKMQQIKNQDRGAATGPAGTITTQLPSIKERLDQLQESVVRKDLDMAKIRETERTEQRQDRRDERAQDRAAANIRPDRAKNYDEAHKEASRDHYAGWLKEEQKAAREELKTADGRLAYNREAEKAHAEKRPLLFGKDKWEQEQQKLHEASVAAERRAVAARDRLADPKKEYEAWRQDRGGNAELHKHITDYTNKKYPELVKAHAAEVRRETQQKIAAERERRHAREQQRGHDRGGRER